MLSRVSTVCRIKRGAQDLAWVGVAQRPGLIATLPVVGRGSVCPKKLLVAVGSYLCCG